MAFDRESGKFVAHQCLEPVLHRVDPAQPAEPRMHLSRRDQISGVDDERLDRNARNSSRYIKTADQCADGTEECIHSHGDYEQE